MSPSVMTDQPSHRPSAPPSPEMRSTACMMYSSYKYINLKICLIVDFTFAYLFIVKHSAKLQANDPFSSRTLKVALYCFRGLIKSVSSSVIIHINTGQLAQLVMIGCNISNRIYLQRKVCNNNLCPYLFQCLWQSQGNPDQEFYFWRHFHILHSFPKQDGMMHCIFFQHLPELHLIS